jgi:hypothetical protein
MCTVIPKRNKNKPLMAKKDIEVFKVGYVKCEKTEYPQEINECISPFTDFKYIRGELYEETLSFTSYIAYFDAIEGEYARKLKQPAFVAKGFHSLKKFDTERLHLTKAWNRIYLKAGYLSFIIPKGSLYYSNNAGCMVSNRIIFNKFIQFQLF